MNSLTGLRRLVASLRRSLVTHSVASLLTLLATSMAFGAALAFPSYRWFALGVGISSLLALGAGLARRHYEVRNQPYLIRSERHTMRLSDGGGRITYENAIKIRSRRRDGLDRYQMRLRWSGTDDLFANLSSLFDNGIDIESSDEFDRRKNPSGYKYITFRINDRLKWRNSIDLGIRCELNEPDREYASIMGFTAHRYPLSLFSRLIFVLEWDQSVPIDVSRTRVVEYPDPSDYEFERCAPRNEWGITRLRRRKGERRVSWQIWPLPASGYFRFEFYFRDLDLLAFDTATRGAAVEQG